MTQPTGINYDSVQYASTKIVVRGEKKKKKKAKTKE